MADLFRIKVVYSTSHLLFPKIIIAILIILAVIMLIQRIVDTKKNKKPFFNKEFRFFEKDCDKVKLAGSAILLVAYCFAMNFIGFIAGSIIFISLFHILFAEKRTLRRIITSIGISTVETFLVWYVFANLLYVTLP